MNDLGDLEAELGHRFACPALLEQALTHGSVRHEQQTGDTASAEPLIEDNERLEFLGDAVVGMVVGELLYRRYPELDEGALTRLRAALVSRKHLGLVGTALDLGSYLRLGRAEERNGGRRKPVLLANCMEALIGALYLESGLAAAAAFIERAVVIPYLDSLRDGLRENRAIGDYKTALQELLQSRRAGQPEYVVKAESGPDHRKRFVVEVRASTAAGASAGDTKAQAEGSTKKKAAQEAARKLYERLVGRSDGRFAGVAEHRPAPLAMAEPLPGIETFPTVPVTPPAENSLHFDLTDSDPAAPREQEHPKPAGTPRVVKAKKRRLPAPPEAAAALSGAVRASAQADDEAQLRVTNGPAHESDHHERGKHAASGTFRPEPERSKRELIGKGSQ